MRGEQAEAFGWVEGRAGAESASFLGLRDIKTQRISFAFTSSFKKQKTQVFNRRDFSNGCASLDICQQLTAPRVST